MRGIEPLTSGTPSNRLIAVTVFFNGKGLYGIESDSCISLSLPYIYIITYFFEKIKKDFLISFSSAERETIKPTLALDFTIRLNPPVKSIILRGEPIIFRSCSKRQRVAADHLKRCSSIIRQYGYSDRHLTSNTLAANPFLISLLVLFQDGICSIYGVLPLNYTRI